MELSVKRSLFALVVCTLLAACNAQNQTEGGVPDPTFSPTYFVTIDFFYSSSYSWEENDDHTGSSFARFVAPAVGFVVFVVAGIIGVLIKARRTMVRKSDLISPRFVQEKVEDIKETAISLLPGKTEEENKEEKEQLEV